jgi:hypothetical protein
MPQPQQTKGGGKGDGENPQGPAANSEQQPQDLSTTDHLARYIKQDLEDGVVDDPVSFLKQYGDEEAPDGDDRGVGTPHDSLQVHGPQSAQVTGDQGNTRPADTEQLFEAVAKGFVGKVDKLLSRGESSPDCRDSEGRTPLIVAAEAGNASLVGVLIRHNADMNAVDPDGETGLMRAAFGGHLRVVELLAENGAHLGIRNNDGSTASEIAQLMKRDPVVAFLSARTAGSTDPQDNGPTTDGPAGASLPVPAVMMTSPTPPSYVPDLDLESNPELEKSPYFEPQTEPETAREDREQEATIPPQEDESKSTADSPGTGDQAEEDWRKIKHGHLGSEQKRMPAEPGKIVEPHAERIEFDALDNKQVHSINGKIIKVFDKAGFEVGDYIIDTVDKGSYIAVLKPRSQENKRWRKLRKHPEWLADPRRLTELRGGCAVRRYCLAEDIDISPFRLSHFIELYYVKDLKLILTLAEEASANNYTVRQLKQAAGDLREHKDDHDPGKEIIRTLDQQVPILEDPDLMDLCTDKDRVLEELSKAERKKIRALIRERKPGLDEWKNLMDTFEGILSDLEND